MKSFPLLLLSILPTARIGMMCCLGVATIFFPGCGYMVGSPNSPAVRTVYVPTFTSNSFRRDVHLQLTEAVQKEILTRTHFRLAKEYNADTRLVGRIVEVGKRVLGETKYDDARQLEYSVAIEIVWEDLRTGQILAQQQFPVSAQSIHLIATAEMTPEVGQSRASAEHESHGKLAKQVVDLMESPW